MAAILPHSLERLEDHEVPAEYDRAAVLDFIKKTRDAHGAELANAQSVFRLLCDALKVDAPALKKAGDDNPYCFEADVIDGKSTRRMDVYKRGHFIFEAKQGVNPKEADGPAVTASKVGHSKNPKGAGVRGSLDWRNAMSSGRLQVGRYAAAVTKRGDPKPPFIVLADVGHKLWVWSSFQPDAADDYGDFDALAAFEWEALADARVFRLLRLIFTAPAELNEDARGQRVTAEIAAEVCKLAADLEKRESPEVVGDFLMKCVFTMFAEDVGLLPRGLFTAHVERWLADKKAGKGETFVRGLRAFWKRMDTGGDLDTGEVIRRFNGYLFKNHEPVDLTIAELDTLRKMARHDWRRVSPAIFGTLLERALSSVERQRLGAHYTPEPYIRRLVERTLMAPLRAEWGDVRVKMEHAQRTAKNEPAGRKAAITQGAAFRKKLAAVRVLDPACGSGNFLFVALKEMKRLEGEVERSLLAVGGYQPPMDYEGESVHPAQFFGVELKPWAAKIAELVLWIGYLQWQVSAGRMARMNDPLIKDLHHIEARDALIAYEGREPVLDAHGKPVMRAVGVTDKGAERRMEPVERLKGVKVAPWPKADFIVGNPPFLGNKRMMDLLGPGYVEAIKEAFPAMPGSADLVMWWWWRAADLVAKGKLRAFGFVTTNSITQTFNRGVVSEALDAKGVRLRYAVADHPWYDEGAAVRIAMTVATSEPGAATIATVADEKRTRAAELELVRVDESPAEVIHPDLSTGAKVTAAVPLKANEGLCFQGFNLVGEGFRLTREEVIDCGYSPEKLPSVIKPAFIGRDLVQRPRERYVIDLHGLPLDVVRVEHPKLLERIVREVKPQRDAQNDKQRREKWWLFGRSGSDLRRAIAETRRFITTSETAKHVLFHFRDGTSSPDHTTYAVALEDGAALAVLSSSAHRAWAQHPGIGARQGKGNDPRWRNLTCFNPFPFPDLTAAQRETLRGLGESLHAHREARLKEHPDLTLTDTYNVLEKLRAGAALDVKEQVTADHALVHTLRALHEDIDRAVLAAYGWPDGLTDDEIVARLVALNAERAAEEARGVIRWLRPEYQREAVGGEAQQSIDTGDGKLKPAKVKPSKAKAKVGPVKWPAALPARIEAMLDAVKARDEATTAELTASFEGAEPGDVGLVLECLLAAQRVARVEEHGATRWLPRA